MRGRNLKLGAQIVVAAIAALPCIAPRAEVLEMSSGVEYVSGRHADTALLSFGVDVGMSRSFKLGAGLAVQDRDYEDGLQMKLGLHAKMVGWSGAPVRPFSSLGFTWASFRDVQCHPSYGADGQNGACESDYVNASGLTATLGLQIDSHKRTRWSLYYSQSEMSDGVLLQSIGLGLSF